MAYRILRGRPLGQEVRRLLDQETRAAINELIQSSPVGQSRRVHDSRKHIKKGRTLLRLARRALGESYTTAEAELRTANRALGPLADARRALDTLSVMRRDGVVRLCQADFSTIRTRLESRAMALETAAGADDLRDRTRRLLECFKQEVVLGRWSSLDRAAVISEVREAHAAARAARGRALQQPSVDSYHRWRRTVKREWHLLRLVAPLTGEKLRDERHQLAALDDCLGSLHDVDVLTAVIAGVAPLSRPHMARLIVELRGHARDLRHRAHRLSSVLDERPHLLARRLRDLWGAVPRTDDDLDATWQPSA